ncbi:Tetratricopeptide repeat superfamily protein [Perilla frutescens var. hirtella]|uniref:Tetratricopeptide repeat superfamily protein n=1 Tax=Perilla frutescens var. hirtella TaxID=608512 RepID=A0AAD4PAH8_PERFH|nr:Tetratricopeptide repeat superfamily protein [Perilla frutescens var. frutescens]KAH6800036.1 Tetratricopeptide repeat superfamily protein [Perilla frutescens var. hirtella]KAH6832763.1 Tetratricopeptide repeat superfamily protein [Perilla frutescens var. hirtella]
MKMTWKNSVNDSKNKTRKRPISLNPNLPFEDVNSGSDANSAAEPLNEGKFLGNDGLSDKKPTISDEEAEERRNLAGEFEAQGNKLAEEGKYREALGKWEAAIILLPEKAVLHEQKAQVLLELGEAWNALKAATRATELDPRWSEAWITLGRAQLNFGEPDYAIESFDKALAIKPDSVEAKDDRKAASHLVKKRKQLHSTGLSSDERRFLVGDEG